jgi:hypothetical protein
MFRFILYLLVSLVLISVLRTVVGVLSKGLGSILKSANSPPEAGPRSSGQLGGDLHRDPVCGTFVAESTPFQRRMTGQVFYYCSDSCKEKHALVAK